jgi:hypothetical protein
MSILLNYAVSFPIFFKYYPAVPVHCIVPNGIDLAPIYELKSEYSAYIPLVEFYTNIPNSAANSNLDKPIVLSCRSALKIYYYSAILPVPSFFKK